MNIEDPLILVIVIYNCILTVSSKDTRIVGGADASTKNFPFYVATTLFHNGEPYSRCGATYISPLWVLTAAHCVDEVNILGNNVFIESVMELDVLADMNTSIVQKRKSIRITIHPNYGTNILDSLRKDIALISIESPFSMTQMAKPAILAANPVNYDGDWLVTIVGYGKTDIYGKTFHAERLQMVVVPLWKRYDCKFSIQNKDTFCVGQQGAIACSGDSGGPAIYKDVVIGVASFIITVDEKTCASVMTVYEDVSKHLRWIRKHVPDVKTSDAQENRISVHIIWVPLITEILLHKYL